MLSPASPERDVVAASPLPATVPIPRDTWPLTLVTIRSAGCLISDGLSSPKCLTSAQEGEEKVQALESKVPRFKSRQSQGPSA